MALKQSQTISLLDINRDDFNRVRDSARRFRSVYCGSSILKDNIFFSIGNYIRKEGRNPEMLFFPFRDEEKSAITFIREDSVFLCINTELALSEEIYAAANRTWKILSYIENESSRGLFSVLKSGENDDAELDSENLEADAFAGLLLVPDSLLSETAEFYDIELANPGMHDLLRIAALFAVPFRTAVKRLYECGFIPKERAIAFLNTPKEKILGTAKNYGIGRIWHLTGAGTESLGSFIENFNFNVEHDFLTEGRKREGFDFIKDLGGTPLDIN
jgi:Zn-dependent peptidase ImmA (M78 family)